MPRNLLRPNLKAVQAIMAAARQLGDDCNWDKLVEMTGYDIRLVKQVLMNRPRLRPKPVDPPAPVPEVPQWVKEVTKVTGLELVFHRKINKLTQQWILISPNGVPLLWLSFASIQKTTNGIRLCGKFAKPCGTINSISLAFLLLFSHCVVSDDDAGRY